MSLLSPSLQAFWAVVQKGTVLEAAKMIDLTQTGVTQRIRSLEKQLGVTLFTRSRKGMRLTDEGESLLRYVKAARDLEGETLPSLNGKKSKTPIEVSICGPSTIMRSRIVTRLPMVLKKFPLLRLRFDLCDDEDVLKKLKSGITQIGILNPQKIGSELAKKSLEPERYVFIGPAAWKKRKFDDILATEAIIDFDAQSFSTLNLLKKYRRSLDFAQRRHFANNIDAMISLIKDGVGFSALPEEFVQPHVKAGTLAILHRDFFADEPVALAWYPRHEMPPYLKFLIETLTKKTH